MTPKPTTPPGQAKPKPEPKPKKPKIYAKTEMLMAAVIFAAQDEPSYTDAVADAIALRNEWKDQHELEDEPDEDELETGELET